MNYSRCLLIIIKITIISSILKKNKSQTLFIVFFFIFQISIKVFCKLEKLSYKDFYKNSQVVLLIHELKYIYIYIYIQGDPPIVIKFLKSNSLLKTKQEITLTRCANNSFQTIKHCNWPIETHYFCTPISFLLECLIKIHFRSVEKYFQPDKRQTVTETT